MFAFGNLFQGWCDSADPRRRAKEVQHLEAEDMKRDMDEHRQKMQMERQDMTSDVRGILNKHAQSIVVHLKVWQSNVFLSFRLFKYIRFWL